MNPAAIAAAKRKFIFVQKKRKDFQSSNRISKELFTELLLSVKPFESISYQFKSKILTGPINNSIRHKLGKYCSEKV